jgi:thiol-disulfide isomerase/thioredoxin
MAPSSQTPEHLAIDPNPPSGRRSWLLTAAVGTLALIGGAWLQQRRLTPTTNSEKTLSPAFWQQTLTRTDGTTLRLADLQKRPILVNFWATWCPPCVEEMPLIEAFYKQQGANGVQVLAIGADKMDLVKKFLSQNKLSLPVAVGGAEVIEMARQAGNLTGSLPFSVLLDGQGRVLRQKLGKLEQDELAQWGKLPG